MVSRFGFALIFATICLWGLAGPRVAPRNPAQGDEPDADYSAELPRIAPLSPEKALGSFRVQKGFRMELAAAEPNVADPVAMAFDEDGRLYVVEMRGYSEQPDEGLSRVRLLEDTDDDGVFDKSEIFLEGLSWPTAIACYRGGVFLGDAPDIFYCKDNDGDGKADTREKVLTGFGKSNVQGLFNTFLWGLDNRIHGATSSSGAEAKVVSRPDEPVVDLRGRDFAFDPRDFSIHATTGGGQHGWSLDEWGRKFVCSNSDHVQQVVYEDRYLARNPYVEAPPPRISIAADGPQAEVYRASPVEPWRIVRTRLRVAGAAVGPIEGGGRAAGYFTGATGLTIYKGDAWPAENRGLAIVGDVGSNLIHRKRLEPNGLEFVAKRIDEKSEFVASTDIWFRPAQYANGPDGALYVADVYREVIEHPASLPPPIKKHLDLTSGRDRGRIYRIVAEGAPRQAVPKMSRLKTAELVTALEHPNAWRRETAARLLFERQDREAVQPLANLARNSKSPLGRMHALYALRGLSALAAEIIEAAFEDSHPRVREHAVALAEGLETPPESLLARLDGLASDEDIGVRFRLAFVLGEFHHSGRISALAAIARRDAGDRWIKGAIFSSLAQDTDRLFETLADDEAFRRRPDGAEFLESLARQAGARAQAAEIAVVMRAVEEHTALERTFAEALTRGISEGLAKRGSSLKEFLPKDSAGTAGELLAGLLESAKAKAADENQPLDARAEAIRALGLGEFENCRELLALSLENRQPRELQLAAVRTLARFKAAGAVELLLAAWPGMGPSSRQAATEALFSRPESVLALFDALDRGEIAPADIEASRLKALAGSGNQAIRARADKIVQTLGVGRRADVVAAYRPALDSKGDIARGRAAFKKTCSVCHKLEGVGFEIGPNLATVQNRGAESILLNVFDPNHEVNPQFLNYAVIKSDGTTVTGIIASETSANVTLKRAENASDTVLRVEIDEMRSTGLSIMPEGLEKQVDPATFADLVAYLLSVK